MAGTVEELKELLPADDAIIALRTAEASSQWEATCGNPRNQTGAA